MKNVRILLTAFVTLALAGCGFRPLYEAGGSADAMRAHLSEVEIAPVADRLGQILTNQLNDRLGVTGTPEYRLEITLDQSNRGFGVRPDASVAQEELTISAQVILRPLSEGIASDEPLKPVINEQFRARTSYDVVLSDFANVQQREDTARRLVLDIAERVERRLALYFSEKS